MSHDEVQLPNPTSDAHLARQWARQALDEGRDDLAQALIGLARRAEAAHQAIAAAAAKELFERARVAHVPMLKVPTMVESPRPQDRSHAPTVCGVTMMVDVSQGAGAEEWVPGQVCSAPIRYAVDPPAHGWYHLDPVLETDHQARPA